MNDENDKAVAGELPGAPEDGTRVIHDGPRLLSVKSLLDDALHRTTQPRAKRSGTTGHAGLDRITGGFRPGFTWVMVAETNWGKSSWAISVADENLKRRQRVLIVSTEDAPSIYGDRLLCRRARVNATRLRDGCLTHDELSACMEVAKNGEPIPVYLDAIGKPAEWLFQHLPRTIKECVPDLVIVDYLQTIRKRGERAADRRLSLDEIATKLRAIIKGAGISGVFCSQLTKKDGQRPDKYSTRDSQDVPNGAEVVVIGYTPDKDLETKTAGVIEKGSRVLMVDKNKDGPKGIVAVTWDEESACFTDQPDSSYDWVDDYSDLDAPPPNDSEARYP